MEETDRKIHNKEDNSLIVPCLICLSPFPFNFNQDINDLDSKINLFCQAFDISEDFFENGFKMAPLCRTCIEVMDCIGFLLKILQDTENKLNLQKKKITDWLDQQNDLNAYDSFTEDTAFDLFSLRQFRNDICRRLRIRQHFQHSQEENSTDIPTTSRSFDCDEDLFQDDDNQDEQNLCEEYSDDDIDADYIPSNESIIDEEEGIAYEHFLYNPDDPREQSSAEVVPPQIKCTLPPSITLRKCFVRVERLKNSQSVKVTTSSRSGKSGKKIAIARANSDNIGTDDDNDDGDTIFKTRKHSSSGWTKEIRIFGIASKEAPTPENAIPCNFDDSEDEKCNYYFFEEASLNAHIRRVHLQKDLNCGTCGKSFVDKDAVLNHKIRVHDEPFPYICDVEKCGQGFMSMRLLTYHKYCHTGDYPFRCEVCDAGFPIQSKLDIHMHKHPGFQSTRSNQNYEEVTRPKRKKIKKKKKKLPKVKPVEVEKEKPINWIKAIKVFGKSSKDNPIPDNAIPCNKDHPTEGKCNYYFFDEASLNAHIRRVHLQKDLNCSDCGKIFKDKTAVMTHKVLVHKEPYPYICDVDDCGQGFLSMRLLNYHKYVHTGDYPYRCEVCNAGFALQCQLDKHAPIHLPSDHPGFICDICAKTCKSEVLMERHRSTHKTERNFKCPQCLRAFKTRKTLNQHLIVHRDDMQQLCQECGATFKNPACLRLHLKRHSKVGILFSTPTKRNKTYHPPIIPMENLNPYSNNYSTVSDTIVDSFINN